VFRVRPAASGHPDLPGWQRRWQHADHARGLERTRYPGIYRRGSRYVVVFRDPAGRQRKRSAETLAEARILKASLAADIARGDYRDVSGVRFDEYAREWCRTDKGRTGRGIRETTLEEYRKDLEIDVIPFFGRTRLSEIQPRHIKSLAQKIADRGVAPATVRTVMALVRALFATAAEEGLIRSTPARASASPAAVPPARSRSRPGAR